MKETLIVNFFGPPGAGKSTATAYVFSKLKMAEINAEMVTEYAKDKVWEDNSEVFNNQAYIFGKQSFRISRCYGKVDVILTDSPLPLSILYNDGKFLTENFNKSVMDVFNNYLNLNYLVKRVKKYNPVGRFQTEKESDELIKPLKNLLEERDITYTEITGDIQGYESVVNDILNIVNTQKGGVFDEYSS